MKKRASKSRSASRARRAVDLVREEAALDARPRVGDDAELFEELRDLRRELPTSIRCPRTSSARMRRSAACAAGAPPRARSCSRVTGIGEKKADAYGAGFLTAIADYEASVR